MPQPFPHDNTRTSSFSPTEMRTINFRLWLAIIATMLLPSIYTTTRVYFIHNLPETWNVSIAAQSMWLNLTYEILQEALLLPLYYVFGKVIYSRLALQDRVGNALLLAFLAYTALSLFVFVKAEWLSGAMSQKPQLHAQTAQFLRIEALAKLPEVLNEICFIVVVALAWNKTLIALVILKSFLVLTFDTLFVGQFAFSLDLGVQGVALTNLLVSSCLLLPTLTILRSAKALGSVRLNGWSDWKSEWGRIATKAGLESAVRNFAFALMILKLMNEVGNAGSYWTANTFIWSWLLMPVLALGTLVKQDAANSSGRVAGRLNTYLLVAATIVCVWYLTMPSWHWFVQIVLGARDATVTTQLIYDLSAFYVVFAFNHILDSYLIGVGRTDLMFYQSLLVSLGYYGTAFILYLLGIFVPELKGIVLLFGGGIVLDSAITLLQFKRFGYFSQSRKT